MLFLSADDMENCLSFQEIMDTLEEAYRIYKTGNFRMPERPVITNGSKKLLFMPCFTEELMGTKVLTVFPDNISLGKPSIFAQMIVNDLKTGEGLCIMDGTRLTALRTGAAGGLGVKYLSDEKSTTLGIIGAGAQGIYQAVFAITCRPIEKVYIYDAFAKDLQPFITKLKAKVGREIECIPCADAATLLKNAEIIMAATTAKDPVLPNDSKLLNGKCLIGVGSYQHDMREFPDALWDVCDKVYVDLEYAMEESGDLCQPIEEGRLKKEQVSLLSDLFGSSPVKPQMGKSTFFKTVGMALVDVVVGNALYKKALEKNIGMDYPL